VRHDRDRHPPAEVLLVEDNLPEARLIERILCEGPIAKNLCVVNGAEEALLRLRLAGADGGAARPDLVVLDLNMPGTDGRDVLSEIKTDPRLRRIPVVVLTTSSAPGDVQQAYDLNANAYVVKPIGLDAFAAVIRSLEEFWLGHAQRAE
jgi:chemotaxis family two-component system response regulator Rcp1